MKAALPLVLPALLLAAPASAAEQSYAGLDTRAVKALSDAEIADLRAGRGMGMALPAELNGYPGPVHVLELADALQLTAEQRTLTQQIYDGMQMATVAIGEQIIAKEAALEAMFAEGTVESDPGAVADLVVEIANLRGALRMAHLRAHLTTRHVLTDEQIAAYARARGYDEPSHQRHGSGHQHGAD